MKVFLALTSVLMLVAFICMSILYVRLFDKKKEAWDIISLERRERAEAVAVEENGAEMQRRKLEQSYINLLEVISSPGEENRINFFHAVFAYNLLSYGQRFRCNPPPKILGKVFNGVQGSTITMKTEKNEYREVFIFAVVE